MEIANKSLQNISANRLPIFNIIGKPHFDK